MAIDVDLDPVEPQLYQVVAETLTTTRSRLALIVGTTGERDQREHDDRS